jgi:N6-adenosine-specific RNA methylase IME4
MYPVATKLELFARGEPRPGWVKWGNELEPEETS